MFIRVYLRASTTEQDARRAKQSLDDFIRPYGVQIACYYAENASGRVLDRPELNRLLTDSTQGDILLVESIDRLTRLKPQDWATLKSRINEKSLKIVCIDLPTSHKALSPQGYDELTDSMLTAVNTLMIEIMASFASKDYEQRRQRQSQGIRQIQRQKNQSFKIPKNY